MGPNNSCQRLGIWTFIGDFNKKQTEKSPNLRNRSWRRKGDREVEVQAVEHDSSLLFPLCVRSFALQHVLSPSILFLSLGRT